MNIVAQAAACDYLTVGAHTYGQPLDIRTWRPHYPEKAQITIGRYCSISQGVTVFLGGNHCTAWLSTYPFAAVGWAKAKHRMDAAMTSFSDGDVVIGNDVWLGSEATIMSGVTIGDGAVIGARAVVADNITPYGIAVGNPAKTVKLRFSMEVVEQLLAIRWWNWPSDDVAEVAGILSSDDVPGLLEYAKRTGVPSIGRG